VELYHLPSNQFSPQGRVASRALLKKLGQNSNEIATEKLSN